MRIRIPSISDDLIGYDRLFAIWKQVLETDDEVTFDFSEAGQLRNNAITFLGGLSRLAEVRFGKNPIDWQSLSSSRLRYLHRFELTHFFRAPGSVLRTAHLKRRPSRLYGEEQRSEFVPFRQDVSKKVAAVEVISYLDRFHGVRVR